MSKQKHKETICCAAPKNKSRNTEIHQGLKYFGDKAAGIIGVFKRALSGTASLGGASILFSNPHTEADRDRAGAKEGAPCPLAIICDLEP